MTLSLVQEQRLIERARTDPEAFGELYDHYVNDIYRFVCRRVGERSAAEDITSEVFLKALGAIGRYRPGGHSLRAWLYQISFNAIVDHHRSVRPAAGLDDAMSVVDPARPIDECAIQRSEAALVWAAIDTLPAQQRTALILKLGEDLRLAQIGVIMGKSEGAIKLLVHRGMVGLRQRLASSDLFQEVR